MKKHPKTYLTVEEAAIFLAVAPQTLYNWRVKKIGPPAIVMGQRAIRYRLSDLEKWVEEQWHKNNAAAKNKK